MTASVHKMFKHVQNLAAVLEFLFNEFQALT